MLLLIWRTANNLIALTINDVTASIILIIAVYSDDSLLIETYMFNGMLYDMEMTVGASSDPARLVVVIGNQKSYGRYCPLIG